MDTLLPGQEGGGPSTTIIPRMTVRQMVQRRQRALDLFDKAFAGMSAAKSQLDEARAAHRDIDQRAREDSYLHLTEKEERHFLKSLTLPEHDAFVETARKVVDRRMWSVLIELTDLERLMDRQAKDELRQQLMENVPEATEDNIFATLQQFVADADMIFKRGIANCFSTLDRRFRSHDGWKIGSRVILTYAFNDYGGWSYNSNQRDALHDIDRTFSVLDGRDNPHLVGGIVAAVERSRRGFHGRRQSEVESDYFKVRGFMNGNAHVWFKRDDLVDKVNRILADYYGAVIPDDREPDDDGGLFTPKTTPAKRYGFFPTPDGPADSAINCLPLHQADDDPPVVMLEPSAGTGNLARRAVKRGAVVDCIEVQPALAQALKRSRLYRDVRCGDFLSIRPDPRRLYDRVAMNPPFDRERDIDHVMHALEFLKPDGCLVAIMSAGTEFRETRKSIAFRDHMKRMRAIWQDLPDRSFASVGTNVNTIMLRVWKDGRRQYW